MQRIDVFHCLYWVKGIEFDFLERPLTVGVTFYLFFSFCAEWHGWQLDWWYDELSLFTWKRKSNTVKLDTFIKLAAQINEVMSRFIAWNNLNMRTTDFWRAILWYWHTLKFHIMIIAKPLITPIQGCILTVLRWQIIDWTNIHHNTECKGSSASASF